MRNLFRLTGLLLVMSLLALGLFLQSSAPIAAQESGSCPVLFGSAIDTAATSCGDTAAGMACFGSAPLQVNYQGETSGTFAAAGDTIPLEQLASLSTDPADPDAGNWGIARLNLPFGEGPGMTAILFGAATLENLVDPNAEPAPTITLQNSAGYPVNLRGGAGTTFATSGTLEEDTPTVADGRNETGDWYRIQSAGGPAWVYRDLVSIVEGDPASLNVLDPADITPAFTVPFQVVTLSTEADPLACGQGTSGLLLQYNGEQGAQLRVNGVDLMLSNATILLQTPSAETVDLLVLDGELDVRVNGRTASAPTNAWLELRLDGESAPLVHQSYSFATIDGTPVDLLPQGMTCTTGQTVDTEIMLYTGPGEVYSPLTAMHSDIHYTVMGQNAAEDGTAWWQLDVAGYARAWVPQEHVQTIGLCGSVTEAAIPPVNVSAGGVVSGSFVPAGQSVWQTDPGLDQVSGTCNQPPMALCAHMAAISPNSDGSISWRGQDLTPYTLYPAGDNTFSYNGRSVLNDGNVSMTLSFVDESNWVMTMQTVFDNDPACTHTLNYTAVRNW